LTEAGQEIHHKAGSQVVLDAGAEITLKAGGSFVKLDPSGVTIVGAQVRINSGGSPGAGSGQAALEALLPGHVEPEQHERIAPLQQNQLKTASLQGAAVVEICQRLKDGNGDNVHRCALGDQCPCR
ncbi:hypothetical protein LLY24_09040, partial [Halomonas sp. wenzhen-202101]|nr:hypothetical protein [Halomonas dongshanensis]